MHAFGFLRVRAFRARRVVAFTLLGGALLAVLLAARPLLLSSGGTPPAATSPAPSADWTPSFARDVQPIFARACVRCHGPEWADKGLRLDSYGPMMAGDSYGTVVIPGGSSLSAVISVVKYGSMPHGSTKLTPAEIDTISRWIDLGAPEN